MRKRRWNISVTFHRIVYEFRTNRDRICEFRTNQLKFRMRDWCRKTPVFGWCRSTVLCNHVFNTRGDSWRCHCWAGWHCACGRCRVECAKDLLSLLPVCAMCGVCSRCCCPGDSLLLVHTTEATALQPRCFCDSSSSSCILSIIDNGLRSDDICVSCGHGRCGRNTCSRILSRVCRVR